MYLGIEIGGTKLQLGVATAFVALAAYLMLRPCAKLWVLLFVRPVRIAAMWAIGLWIAGGWLFNATRKRVARVWGEIQTEFLQGRT